ncbi:MAG: hypothetical protein JWO38_6464 [Gemmataceae bacterium]|nr:hypothetical protein [Gemmataceae bacterium]
MPVRRRLFLSVGFIGASLLLAGIGSARAQFPGPGPMSPGRHTHLPGSLTSDQIKRALEPFALPPGLTPEVADALREKLQREQGIDPKLADAAIQKLLSDPAFRKQMEEAARKSKGAIGKQPTLEEIERLRKSLPDFLKNLPGKQPKIGEPPFPPPQGPGGPPRTGDPRGGPIPRDGPRPPDGPPPMPPPMRNGDPPANPEEMPRPDGPELPQPAFPPAGPEGASPFDPNETPRERAMRTFASMWERNVGPLDETPAVKRALFDLAAGTEDFKDAEGNSILEGLAKESGDAVSFADFVDKSALGDSWSMPKFDLPSFSWSRSNPDIGRDRRGPDSSSGDSWWNRRSSSSRSAGSSGGGGFGLPGLEGSWLPVILLAVILLGALVLWRFWYLKDPRSATPYDLAGLGPWPIDPHRIATRRHVVLAFEYLSVLICGPAAKTWTHTTIATALADLAATHVETASMLARLYELARYTPADEPLSTAELAEARRLICRLAGLESE